MKTTDEIILDLGLEYKINPYLLDQVKLSMQIYAQSAIDEIKEKIANSAMPEYVDGKIVAVDKESISEVTIELK